MEAVLVALVSGICVAIPNMYATYKQSKKQNEQSEITNKQLKENKEDNNAMRNSMIILLRSQIVSKCEKYQDMGYLPDYARSCLSDLFAQYTMLGGNHGVNILVDETLHLPAKKGDN